MPLFKQAFDVLEQVVFGHIFGGIVVANDRPAFPLFEPVKRLFCTHPFPCQQADEVPQEQLHIFAREAPRGFVVRIATYSAALSCLLLLPATSSGGTTAGR